MKLKELLLEVNPGTLLVKSDKLNQLKERTLQCEEFTNVTSLHFCDTSEFKKDNGEILKCDSTRFKSDLDWKLKGDVIIRHIGLTPKMYKFEEAINRVNKIDEIYFNVNSNEDETTQTISFTFPKESTEGLQEKLHNVLDKVLENPDSYELKGYRDVVIEGVFNFEN